MSTYEQDLKHRMELLPGYVQPRYKQDRDEILAQLNKRLLTHTGSFPQVVDSSIIEVGDEITVVRAIETLPLWKATVKHIIPVLNQSESDVFFETTEPIRIEGHGTEPLPTRFSASSMGFAELSREGLNLPSDYFSYTHVFLSGVDMPLETEPEVVAPPEKTSSTLPDGWWAWDV